ncbi:MAG TPA: gamma-glutamyltransferase, partial [Candidatus Coprocola pullicola]|nr:gamma-glutamyltransferase [Candidatus Coprocola pullicola]
DLYCYEPEWVEPISIHYKGYDIWEMPPNGHGIVALMALNILKKCDISHRESVDTYHKQLEAMKLAFEDGKRYISDKRFMKVTVEQLLSEKYAEKRKQEIGNEAILPKHGNPFCGGTVYLCTADQQGNMVSYIQSNYENFGSAIVIPDTGIALHDRGANFSLDETMENCIAPCKKPYHTIIPGFITKNGQPVGPFGVMGGFMQPQGHVQTIMNLIDFHMNPQEALDAPRWQWIGGKKVLVEREFPFSITEELLRKGHEIFVNPESIDFGRGQMIIKQSEDVFAGATEPRADGMVAVW